MDEIYRSLQEIIEAKLRRDIVEGVFPLGASLTERELTERYQVSRGPVREVLRTLEVQGLVVRHRTKGVRVASLSLEEMHEIFDIRCELEELAIRRAVSRTSKAAPAETVLTAYQALKSASEVDGFDTGQWLGLNNAFHCAIYELAQAPTLLELVRQLMVRVEGYTRLYLENPDHLRQSIDEHEDILNSFLKHDAARCVKLTREHLNRSRDKLAIQLPTLVDQDAMV